MNVRARARLSSLVAVTSLASCLCGPVQAQVTPSCERIVLTLPPEGADLPDTTPQGIAIPLELPASIPPELAEDMISVLVADAAGTIVDGGWSVSSRPSLLAWMPWTALEVGTTYDVTVTIQDPPESCPPASQTVALRVSVRDAVPTLAPVVDADLIRAQTWSVGTCCNGVCDDPGWSYPEVRVSVPVPDDAPPWRYYRFGFSVDDRTRLDAFLHGPPGSVLEHTFEERTTRSVRLCTEVEAWNPFGEPTVTSEPRCFNWTGNPPRKLECQPETASDVSVGDGPADEGFAGDGGGADCACTSVVATHASQGAPLRGVLLALLGLGALVWRRRARA